MKTFVAVLVSILVLGASGALRAQDVAAETSKTELVNVLRTLEPGERLRVELSTGGRQEGRMAGGLPDSLAVRDGVDVAVPVEEIERIWTRDDHLLEGVLVGGGVGLLAGAVFGAWIGDFACAEIPGEDCTFELALAVGGIGAAGGAGLGAVVGLLIPGWNQRWP